MEAARQSLPADPVPVTREIVEEEVVNDSLGTIDSADSTGVDEDKETGDAKVLNFSTRED